MHPFLTQSTTNCKHDRLKMILCRRPPPLRSSPLLSCIRPGREAIKLSSQSLGMASVPCQTCCVKSGILAGNVSCISTFWQPAGKIPLPNNKVRVETNLQNNNSIQFNGYFLTWRLNSKSTYYKANKQTRNTKTV